MKPGDVPAPPTSSGIRDGLSTTEAAARLAEEIGAGLVIVGSRGLGPLRRALMGSVSTSVVRHAHCSVLVVRDQEHAERQI